MKLKVLCTCRKCRRKVTVLDGEEVHGRVVISRTRNKHIIREEMLEGLDDKQVEEAMSSTILLTAAAQPLSRQGSGTLPIRRRDSQALWDRELAVDEGNVVSVAPSCLLLPYIFPA